MKAWQKCFLCTAMAFVLAFSASSAGAANSRDITILGGSSGGLWAIICEGISETVRRSFPDFRVTTEPGKDGPNQVMTSRKEVQFALTSDLITIRALKGEVPFKEKLSNLRLVAVVNLTQAVQFFVDAKAGISKIQEIKDKKYPLKIAVNRQGTVMDVISEQVLESYGISYKDIASWGGKVSKIPGPEAMDLWDAGQMDAIIEVSQFPVSRFFELGQKHDLRLLSIDPDKREALNKKMGSTSVTIPAGTYPFQKEDCSTLCTQLVLITNAEQPDEVVESVLKAMLENIAYLRSVHANLRELSPEIMSANANIPMHPAAEKFFKSLKK